MLSENDLVAARKILSGCFTDKCHIYERVKFKNQNSVTCEKCVLISENIPCKISFRQNNGISKDDNFIRKNESAVLFLPFDTKISENSVFSVNHLGSITNFAVSGNIKNYQTHTEVFLSRTSPKFISEEGR